MSLSNHTRKELLNAFRGVEKVALTHFLAEYLAEAIVVCNQGDTKGLREVEARFAKEFANELSEQINERT